MKKHRCAVCWAWLQTHQDWLQHVEAQHDSPIRKFGYHVCEHADACPARCTAHTGNCPGVEHARRIRTEGAPAVRRAKPLDQPYVARDGTTYTPQRLIP
jgi:hypothetical protein